MGGRGLLVRFPTTGGGTLTAAPGTFNLSGKTVGLTYTPNTVGNGVLNTTFALKSSQSGTLPFTMGQCFKDGEVASASQVVVGGAAAQIVAKSFWPSGYVRHARIDGTYSSTAGVTATCSLTTGTATTGTTMTTADITAAALQASVQLGSFGTVTLAGATLRKTWFAGHKAICAEYGADVGTSLLEVRFFVTLYVTGRARIRYVVSNDFLDNGAGGISPRAVRTYVPTVTVGGVAVYTNSGSALTHYANTMWTGVSWVGGDPDVTAFPNPTYLTDTKQIPNFAFGGAPDGYVLDAQVQASIPLQRGNHVQEMGGTGFQAQIGILPDWEGFYPASGDVRALRAVIAGAESLGSYPIDWRSKTTRRAAKPSAFASWSYSGPSQGGSNTFPAGALQWEFNHHPSAGYLAYLLTGDPYFYEMCLGNVSACFLSCDINKGSGTDRVLAQAARGLAWALRSTAQAVAIAHAGDAEADDFRTLLTSNYAQLAAKNTAFSHLGILYIYPNDVPQEYSFTEGIIPQFQQSFMTVVHGHVYDMNPLSSMTSMRTVRDSYYKWTTNLAGPMGDPTAFGFSYDSAYSLKIADTPTSGFAANAAEVFIKSFGGPNSAVDNTLYGGSASAPTAAATGYWGEFQAALAFAVDHGYTGARQAWLRLRGATNWDVLATAYGSEPGTPPGFNNHKAFAILPRVIPSAVGMPAWTNGVVVGQWVQIPGSSMNGVNPTIAPAGNTGPSARINAYNGLVLDRTNRTLHALAEGGHHDYSGNEDVANDLMRDVPTWAILKQPTAREDSGNPNHVVFDSQTHNTDGTAPSAHILWNQVYRHTDHSIIRLGSYANWSDPAKGTTLEYRFDLTTLRWDGEGTYPNTSLPYLDVEPHSGVDIDRSTGAIYHAAGSYGGIRRLNPDNTQEHIAFVSGANNDWAYYRPFVVDHTRQKVYVMGDAYHNDTGGYELDIATKTLSRFDFTGPLANIFGWQWNSGGNNGYSAIYDETLDRIVVKMHLPGTILMVHPTTKAVTEFATTGSEAMPYAAILPFSRAQIVPMPDGTKWMVYYPEYSSPLWALKLN